jgi:MFS family permease
LAEIKVDTEANPAAEPAVPTGAASPNVTARLGWYTVWMTAVVAVMSQVDRGILALFVQPMKRDFHLTDTQVSILLGFAFTFFYVVGGPPLSRAADNGIRKHVIAGALTVWSLATACFGIAQSYWAFFAARAVVGASEAGCGPASLSMIADVIKRDKLPRAYALYNSGFLGGSALSLVIGGVLIGMFADLPPLHLPVIGTIYNWQLVFILLGVPGLVIAAIFLLTVPEPARRGSRKPGGYPLREVFAYLYKNRKLHGPFLIAVLLMAFQIYGIVAWVPAFFERTYGWGPAKIGPLLGTSVMVTSVIGLFAGARLTEILSKKHDDAYLRVMVIANSVPIPFFVAGFLMPTPWLALACYATAMGFYTMGAAGFNSAINVSSPNEMRSQITVLYFILQNAVAGSLGPTAIALITDYVAHNESDLRYVLAAVRLVVGPLTVFFLWRAMRAYGPIFRQRVAEGAA